MPGWIIGSELARARERCYLQALEAIQLMGEYPGQRCVEGVVSYDYGEEIVILRVFSERHVNKVEITFFPDYAAPPCTYVRIMLLVYVSETH